MENTSSGQYSLQGFEYQRDVTVWVAMNLIFEQETCDSILAEPPSQEDIEALLSQNVKLIIQVKKHLDTNGPITSSEFAEILKGKDRTSVSKSTKRSRPLELLDCDCRARFLLITDVQVQKCLGEFCIKKVGEISQAVKLPSRLNGNSLNIPERISILHMKKWPEVKTDAETILRKKCFVPALRSHACREKLAEEIWIRMDGTKKVPLTKNDIESVVRKHGGLPAVSKELSYHVLPRNIEEIQKKLNEQHCVMIYGEPGVGKSLLAKQLILKLQQGEWPFESVRESPRQQCEQRLNESGQTVFFLDDPWGPNKDKMDARWWRQNIDRLLQNANPDKKFVVVSPENILREVWPHEEKMPECLKKCAVKLASPDYTESERLLIRDNVLNAKSATQEHQEFIKRHWREISKIERPEGLVAALEKICELQPLHSINIQEIVKKYGPDRILETWTEQILDLEAEDVLAIFSIWASLYSTPRKYDEYKIRLRLERSDWQNELINFPESTKYPISDRATWLEKIRWIVEDNDRGLQFKNSQEEAVKEAMRNRPEKARVVISDFIKYLNTQGRHEDCVRLFESFITMNLELDDPTLRQIDDSLIQNALTCDLKKFPRAFQILGNKCKGNCDEALFARAFHPSHFEKPKFSYYYSRESTLHFKEIKFQKRPDFTVWNDAQKEAISKNDNCFSLARRTLSTSLEGCINLPNTNGSPFLELSPEPFKNELIVIDAFTELWGTDLKKRKDLAQACIDAFLPFGREYSRYASYETVLEGFLRWGDDEQLIKALYEFSKVLAEPIESVFPEVEYHDPGTYDAIDEDFIENDYEEQGFDPLPQIISELAERKGNLWLAQKVAELNLFDVCEELRYLKKWVEPKEVKTAPQDLNEQTSFLQKVRAFEDRNPHNARNCSGYFQDIIGAISWTDIEKKIMEVLCQQRFHEEDPETLSSCIDLEGVALLKQILNDDNLIVSKSALRILAFKDSEFTRKTATTWLNRTEWMQQVAVECLSYIGDYATVTKMLFENQHSSVRRAALRGLAPFADENQELREKILKKGAKDASAYVREECADIIGEFRWKDGLPYLAELLRDHRNYSNWSDGSGYYNYEPVWHKVAISAAHAFKRFEEIPDDIVIKVLKIIQESGKAQSDFEVHFKLILLITKWKNADLNRTKNLLIALLNDNWYEKSPRNPSYVRRYASAIALALLDSENFENEDWEKIKLSITSKDKFGQFINPAKIAGPLFFIAAKMEFPTYEELGEIAKERFESDKLPWQDLLAFASPEKWLLNRENFSFLASDHVARFIESSSRSSTDIDKSTITKEQVLEFSNDEIVDIVKRSKELAPILSYAINQIMGDGWSTIVEKHGLEKTTSVCEYLPRLW